jgi:hypothetical protein
MMSAAACFLLCSKKPVLDVFSYSTGNNSNSMLTLCRQCMHKNAGSVRQSYVKHGMHRSLPLLPALLMCMRCVSLHNGPAAAAATVPAAAEPGYNAIEYEAAVNSWVRRVRILNADSGIKIYSSVFNTVSDVEIGITPKPRRGGRSANMFMEAV